VKRVICGVLLALLSALLVHPVLAESSEVCVVLVHGKWRSPQSMLPLARDLESRSFEKPGPIPACVELIENPIPACFAFAKSRTITLSCG
jgi:hypothetical protein